ncbi:MAG: CPBP family intramembrane metalloprotease [Propionibacteriaceae bacterium]|nr:CPBP family intramembrane metalloprotease [Propionibacteriaceae bacterium]
MSGDGVLAPAVPEAKSHPGIEILLVLGISLGRSAVYSILSIVNSLTMEVPLNQQSTSMNSSVTPDRPWLDLAYQVANIAFPIVPALLALYFLRLSRDRIGFDLKRPAFDALLGLGIAAGIGIPGLVLYFAARAAGLNLNVQPANLAANWWTVPVLVGAAAMNGILEEVVIIGFFFAKAAALNWRPWVIIAASALIRGSYHLYQGFGGFAGNIAMGVIFGLIYLKTRRVGPLVAAHTFIDIAAFVGYSALAPLTDWF